MEFRKKAIEFLLVGALAAGGSGCGTTRQSSNNAGYNPSAQYAVPYNRPTASDLKQQPFLTYLQQRQGQQSQGGQPQVTEQHIYQHNVMSPEEKEFLEFLKWQQASEAVRRAGESIGNDMQKMGQGFGNTLQGVQPTINQTQWNAYKSWLEYQRQQQLMQNQNR